eukprot:5572846-Amphidinium_carterae.2
MVGVAFFPGVEGETKETDDLPLSTPICGYCAQLLPQHMLGHRQLTNVMPVSSMSADMLGDKLTNVMPVSILSKLGATVPVSTNFHSTSISTHCQHKVVTNLHNFVSMLSAAFRGVWLKSVLLKQKNARLQFIRT